MSDLPEPLTPQDCDLRGLPFMPLEVIRLFQSTTYALSTGDEFKAAFTLWCASWLEVPAASLPSDDRMLEYLSKAKQWKKVKSVALRGWLLCSDGRLYHSIVAKNALEAWDRRSEYREEQENKDSRQKRWREKVKHLSGLLREVGVTPPTNVSAKELERLCALHVAGFVDGGASTSASTRDGFVDGKTSTVDADETAKTETVKRQGQGQLTSKAESLSVSTVVAPQPIPAIVPPPAERSTPKREGHIAILLRNAGVKPFTSMHPLALSWAANSAITDAILEGAVDMARQAKGEGVDISPNYLKPIVEQLLNPPEVKPAKEPTDQWWLTNAGIDRKGRELDMRARGTESYNDFKDRIFAELRKRGGKAA